MVDRSALGAWIQPQHLDEDALRGYREAFQSHPARMVVLENFLVDKMAERLTRFLTSEAEFGVEYGLYSVEGAVSEEDWQKAEERDRFFRLSRLAATPPQFQMSPNTLTYLKFRQTFQRPEYKAFFEALSGLPLGSSDDFGVHSMTTGDFLRPHTDDNRNRRVALVIYLSPDWQPSFGGELHLIDKEGNAHPVEPRYNSMVVFDTLGETTHLVEPITAETGGAARLTIGGWYHNPN